MGVLFGDGRPAEEHLAEAGFEERLHPRGRGGKFAQVLGKLTKLQPGHSTGVGGHLVTRGHGNDPEHGEHVYALQYGSKLLHRGSAEEVAERLAPAKPRVEAGFTQRGKKSGGAGDVTKGAPSVAKDYDPAEGSRKMAERFGMKHDPSRGAPGPRDPGEDMSDLFNRGMASPGGEGKGKGDRYQVRVRGGKGQRFKVVDTHTGESVRSSTARDGALNQAEALNRRHREGKATPGGEGAVKDRVGGSGVRSYTIGMSKVGRDQRIDQKIEVQASSKLEAEQKAEQKWRADGNTGRFYTVEVRATPQGALTPGGEGGSEGVAGGLGPREGLEGPFRFRGGWRGYYDPKEGRYYDPARDMYMPREFDPHTGETPDRKPRSNAGAQQFVENGVAVKIRREPHSDVFVRTENGVEVARGTEAEVRKGKKPGSKPK